MLNTAKPKMLTRHKHSRSIKAMVLPEPHPAVVEGRPLVRRSANEHKRHKAKILVSGINSRKIGRVVTKGRLKGFPIYTLTLTERATCPRDCSMWRACYGNRMPWALRWPAGAETEAQIEKELAELQEKHPKGFLVRLHVLGDFYSPEYVVKWVNWLGKFPALHVFGYTARHDDVGTAVLAATTILWDRFAIRSSEGKLPGPAAYVVERDSQREGIVCPAQLHKTKTCGTCALCWDAPNKTILFHPH